ncbi:MAG: hypothetical protein JOZ08_23700 [Verrucomicrobia bacterium]|nr:hypothetical protein [Verrucomicrobiota bacterium]MBV8274123.1 hypothetical protein [Verrucomicrobiota bacterium]
MKGLTRKAGSSRYLGFPPSLRYSVTNRVWLASAALCLLAGRGYAQGAMAGPAPASAATASSNASVGQFATQLVQGMNIITASGFIAGCVMVMNGFLNARRDENWKMTVIHGLGVAGSVALCKTLFSLFVANGASIVSQF